MSAKDKLKQMAAKAGLVKPEPATEPAAEVQPEPAAPSEPQPAPAEESKPAVQPGADRKQDKPTGWPGTKPAVERASSFYSKA